MASRFDGERRAFVEAMLGHAEQARTWFDIDVEAAAEAMGEERNRLVRALDYLAEQEMMELQAKGACHRYRRLNDRPRRWKCGQLELQASLRRTRPDAALHCRFHRAK